MKNSLLIPCRNFVSLLAALFVCGSAFAQYTLTPYTSFGNATTPGWLPPGSSPYLSTANNERGFAYNPVTGNLVLPSRNGGNFVAILNGTTGEVIRTLDTTGVSGGTLALMGAGVSDDGAIYVSILQSGSSALSPYKVYKWDSENSTSAPTVAFSQVNPQVVNGAFRFGDAFAVRGNGTSARFISAGASTGNSTMNGTLTPNNGNFMVGSLDGSNANTIYMSIPNTLTPSNDYRLGLTWVDDNTIIGSQGTSAKVTDFTPTSENRTTTNATVVGTVSTASTDRPIGFSLLNGRSLLGTVNTISSLISIYDISTSALLAYGNTTSGVLAANGNANGNFQWGPVLSPTSQVLYAMSTNQGIQAMVFSLQATSDTIYWLGSNGTLWSAGSNWSTDASGTPTADFANGADIIFSATGSSNSSSTDLGGDLTIGSLTIDTANPVGISGGNLTVTGGTTINSGTLTIGNGGTTGSISGSITNNAALVFNRSNDSTYSGNITGTGTLEKLGNGVLTLANSTSTAGATTINDGGMVLSNAALTVNGNTIISSGNFTVGSGASFTQPIPSDPLWLSHYLFIGDGDGSSAHLNIDGGNLSGFRAFIGNSTNSTGFATMNGGTWANSNSLEVGSRGNGTLLINSGNISNSAAYIANHAGSAGLVTMNNGTWTNSDTVYVGDDGHGTLIINDGAISSSSLRIGNNAGSTGVLTMHNGTFSSLYSLNIGSYGNGTLNLAGGTLTGDTARIGDSNGSTGVVNVSGGNLSTTGSLFRLGQRGNGTLNLTGGTVSIQSGTGSLTMAWDATSTGILNIGNGTTAGELQAAKVALATGGSGGMAIVNFNHTGNHTFAPILEGALTVNKLGTGTTTLTADSGALTGNVSINSGTLAVLGSLANATTQVNSGGTLMGDGTLGDVTVNTAGAIAPGNSPGIITVGNLTLNGGAIYNWETGSSGTAGTAGTDWDLISSLGTLTLNATSGSPISINLSSLGNATLAGVKKTSWEIGNFTAGITGFNKNAFSFNAASMTGSAGNYFMSLGSGNLTLVLNYKTGAVWNTASGNWSTAAQWEGDSLPVNGDALEFSGPGGISTNDSYLTTVSGITFTSTANGSYTLNGTDLSLGANGLANDSNSIQTVSINLALGADQTFAANTADLVVSGDISGGYSLTKEGNETLILSGVNSYTGETTINAGTLAIASGGSLTGTSKIFVGNTTSTNTLAILGTVSTGNLTLSEQVDSDNNSVTVGGDSSPASLTVSNLINVGFGGTGNTLDILGNGTVTAASTWIGGYGSNNTLNLSGGMLNSTSDIIVGYFAGENALNITAGGNATAGSVTVGLDAASANNTILVSGSGSVLHTAGLIYLGQNGTANSFEIKNGGKVISQNSDAVLGLNDGSNGNALSINGTGSQFTNNGTLYVGKGGSENTLAIDNGGSLTTRNARIGHDATSSNNTATISGAGSTWTNTGTLRVGSAGSNNALAVNSGANVTVAGNTFIGHGAASANNLVRVEGTGSVLNLANATVGLDGSDNTLLVADSGTIHAIGIQLSGTNATLQIGNGAAAGTLTTSLGIGTGNGSGHQVVFNHTDANLAFSPILTGNLSVSHIGNGTTSLTADNIYTGSTLISAGTLSIGNGSNSGSVTGNITNNAALVFNRSDAAEYAGAVSGNGTLEKLGTGSLTLSGNNTYTGGTTLSGGGLNITGSVNGTSSVALNGGSALAITGAVTAAGPVMVNTGTITISQGGSLTTLGATIVEQIPSLFVSNYGGVKGDTISVFNKQNGQLLGSISGNMSGSIGLTLDGTGTLYVTNFSSNTTSKYISNNGTYLGGISGNMSKPWGVAVDSAGTLYVANYNYGTSSVSKYSTANGTYLGSISANMSSPSGLAVDGNGTLYVANRFNNKITKYSTANGTYLGSISGNMSNPFGVALDTNGTLYVANFSTNLITKYSTANGTYIGSISGNMSGAHGVALDSDGTVYVPNYLSDTISKYLSDGTYLGSISGNMSYPSGVAIGNYTVESTTLGGITLADSAADNAMLNIGTYGGSDTTATLTAPYIAFGNGTAALNLNLAGNQTFSADLVGGNANNTINQLGTGRTTLTSANSTYAGAVNINSGTLKLDTSLANATFAVQGGTLAGGNITVGAVTINSGGTIAPGSSPGTITTGNMTWNGGGIYAWELASANGSSVGTDWDFINSTGTLTIGANSTNKFTIAASTNSSSSGFDPNAKYYSWKIAEFANIQGFSSDKFTINATGFGGGLGVLTVSANNTALSLNYATMATWNAGTGNWTTTGNWEGDFAPINGVAVEYAGPLGTNGTSTNDDLTLANISGLTFTSGANGSFTIAGGALEIGAGGLVNNSTFTQTVGLNITLGANQTFAANTANLVVAGNISGNAALTKEGNQTLILSGSNTYTGATSVSNGTVVLTNRNALYSGNTTNWTADKITVGGTYGSNQTGSVLALKAGGAGQFTASDIATLANNLVNGNASGDMTGNSSTGFAEGATLAIDTTGGNITLGEALVSGSNIFQVNGSSRTQTYSLVKLGSGTLNLGGNASQGPTDTNNFSFGNTGAPVASSLEFLGSGGMTVVQAGTMRLGQGVGLVTPSSFVGGASGDAATLQIDGGSMISLVSSVGTRANALEDILSNQGNQTNPTFMGHGVMNVTGGTVRSSLGMFVGGSSGQLNISGGDVTVRYEEGDLGALLSFGLCAGVLPDANGTINVSGGHLTASSISLGGHFATGFGVGGNGTLNISGGNVTAGDVYLGSGNGSSGLINVSSGTLMVAGGFGPVVSPLSLGTQGSSVFVVGNDGAGALSINGTGTVIVAGTLSKGNLGNINLESGGTLQIGADGTDGSLATDITNNGTLVLDVSGEYTHLNAIGGTGIVNKAGLGTLTLSGSANTYSGATNINAGTLQLDGTYSNIASAISINATGTLSGSGRAGDVTVLANGTISPNGVTPDGRLANADIGTLWVGNLTLSGGGIYNWQLASATGEAGTDWDLISATGGISINATSGNKFVINATALPDSGFNPEARIYTWKIAESAAPITGYSADKFQINTTGFESGIGAYFTSANSTALNLNYATVATWNTGSGNWTTASNWEDSFGPINGVAVEYAGPNGSGGTSTNNDTNLANIRALEFTSGANASYTIAGGNLTIDSGIVNNSTFTQTVGLNITLGANQTFAANTANLVVSGNISGGYSLTKEGNETLTFSGANSYTGETTINAGTLAIAAGGSLTGTSKIFVGNTTSSNTLAILGTVATGNLTLSHQVGSDNNTVTLGGGASPALLTVSNLINVGFGGTGNTLDILGNGTVTAASTWIGGYGANNSVNLTGGVLNSTSDVIVGYFAGENALNITAGGNATAGSVTVGLDAASANNTILVSGSGSALHTAGLIYLGQNGTANSFEIENGGKVISQNADAVLGLNAGSNGNALSINGTGSQFTNNGTLYVGKGGSENTLAIANGGSLTTRNARIGHDATSSNNTATISGAGSTWTNTGTLRVGNIGSNNTLAVNSGANVTVAGNTFIGHGAASANNLVRVEGAGSVLNLANATVGLDGSNNTLLVADSGTINAIGIQLSGTNSTLQIGNGAAAGTLTTSLGIGTGAGTGHQVVFNHTDSNLAFSPILTGNLSLSHLGNGTTSLTADNTYTGGTTISAGTLSIGNGGTTGSVSGDISNNATLAFNRSDAAGYGGVVSGSGVLVKNGDNTLTLSGNNTYTGGTIVNAGTLAGTTTSLQGAISNSATVVFDQGTDGTYSGILSGSGVLVKNGNNTLTLSGNNTYTGGTTVNSGTLAGTTASLQGAISNSATVAFDQGIDGTYSGAVSGSGVLVKQGSGTVTLAGENTHTGGTTVAAGTLSVTGSLGDVANNASFVVQQSGLAGNVTNQLGAIATNNGTVASLANAGTFTNGGNITGSVTTNGTLEGSGLIGSTLEVAGGTATIGAGGQVLGASTVSSGTLRVGGTIAGVTNSATLAIQQGGSTGALMNLASATNNGTVASLTNLGTFTNSGNLTGDLLSFGGSVMIAQGGRVSGNSTIGGGDLIVNGQVASVASNALLRIEQGGSAGDVTNLGDGTGTNNGTVASLLNSGAFSNAGNITTTALSFGTFENTGTIGGALTIGGGQTTITGTVVGPTSVTAGTLAGNGTLGAVEILSGGTIAPGTGNGTATLTVGNLILNGGGIYNWQTSSINGAAGTDWDLISSLGTLTLNATSGSPVTFNLSTLGNATLVDLKKASWEVGTFANGITGFAKNAFSFNATSMAGNDGRYYMSLGSGNTTLVLNYKSAATWNTGSGNWTTASQWEDEALPENGDEVEFSGPGGTSTNNFASGNLSTISGFNFVEGAGAYTVNGNTLQIGEDGIINASSNLQTIGMDLTAGGFLTVDTATAGIEISGTISGNSALTKNGNANLTLSGNNTYAGGTTISAGTLALGGTQGRVLGTISVGSGATFAVNRTNEVTLGNTISGAGSFAHTGSNRTSLTAANDYTGGTTISSGTLWTQNAQALGTGNVRVNGGTLLSTSSQETIMGNQTLTVGGNLDWTSGKIAFYDTGTSPLSGDLTINVGGNFSASAGNKTFDFSGVEALNSGNYTLVSTGGLVHAAEANFVAAHGPYTTLYGNFTTTNNTVVYTVTGATSGGSDIQNNGGPNTPVVANYDVTGPTITVGANNRVNALTFSSSAPLAIQAGGELTVTSGTLAVQSGSSVVSGGTLNTPGNFDKTGAGELDLENTTNVAGIANVVQGLLSVNGQLNANSVLVDPTATLGGAGVIVASNVIVNGNLSPGNSPGTLSVAGNLVLGAGSSTVIEIASPTNFDRIVVSGTATLGGTLSAVAYGGGTITPGTRYDFLQAGSIVGAYDTLVAPEGLRIRFLNSGTLGTLLFGPASFVPYALNQNQIHVAKALDRFVLATEGDAIVVGTALDSLTSAQFPSAFDQIMPGFYQSVSDIAIEQTFNQTQLINQRLGSVRLGAQGFQAIGLSQPIKFDKDGKSSSDAKTASPIVESPVSTNWNSWILADGEFSMSRGLAGVPNYNNNAGGFLLGADYRLSENFAAGLFAGYEYSYAKYNGGSSTQGNSALFGLYGSYTHEDGYYADAVVSGGYTGFQTRRSIGFGSIDRTARANPNSGQFSAAVNLGKDFEIGKFTLGPIVGAQYTYAGIGGFTETGADSLNLALGQQNADSLRTTLGARLAYDWEVCENIVLVPEVRGFWMHEFLNNPETINAALGGGSGPSFDYGTDAPYRNSVFGGVGVSAKVGERWSGSVFYNVNFGGDGYSNNIISTMLNLAF